MLVEAYLSEVLYSIVSVLKHKYITAYSWALQEIQMKDTLLGKYPILHIVLYLSFQIYENHKAEKFRHM